MPCPQLMGIETSADYGGAESSFTSAIIAIEELARVDPSVSVLCDVHNTLVATIVRKYGNKEQQEKWLPLLSESMVCALPERRVWRTTHTSRFAAWLILSIRTCFRIGCVRAANTGGQGWKRVGDQRYQDVDHELLRGRLLPHLCERERQVPPLNAFMKVNSPFRLIPARVTRASHVSLQQRTWV